MRCPGRELPVWHDNEWLAPFAIGAAVGGTILGWIIQAALFSAVF